MTHTFKLDPVALLKDLPHERLRRGQVGTVVELYGPGRYEVEFADADGQTLAMLTLPKSACCDCRTPDAQRAACQRATAGGNASKPSPSELVS